MTDKYKIIHKNQPPSDEEINTFKDFGSIESKIVNKSIPFSKTVVLKSLLFAVAFSAAGFFLIRYSLNTEVFKNKNTDTLIEESLSEEIPQELVENDNIEIITGILPENKEMIPQVIPDKKQTSAPSKKQVNKQISKKPPVEKTPQVSITNRFNDAEPIVGFDSLYRYFKESLIYPKEHVSDSIEGIVKIQFEVNKQGEIIAPIVMNSLGELFDKEALRVIKNMPDWKPAMVNETPLSIKKQIAIQFKKQN